MSNNVTVRTTCRLCGGAHLEVALSLGNVPLGDNFIQAKDLSQSQTAYPVTMMLCLDCGQVQLSNMVDPGEIYTNYVYKTSVSHGLVAHFEHYADVVMARFNLTGFVVEIGSNEGSMLRYFKHHGWRVMGVDPALDIAHQATNSGIGTLPEYFTVDIGRSIRRVNGAAQLIVANNVLANIDDLDDIAAGVKALLAPDGLFVFETSYLLDVVEKGLIDTIFSEHVSYFSVAPLRRFFQRHGLELIDAERTTPKGGSLRCTVQLQGGPRKVSVNVDVLANVEGAYGLDQLGIYHKLERQLAGLKYDLWPIIQYAKEKRQTIAAWGASDGGTSMLYYFRLGPHLTCLIDDNPAKIGTFSPGYHLPVLPSSILETAPPDVIILLAWRYADEIIKAHPE